MMAKSKKVKKTVPMDADFPKGSTAIQTDISDADMVGLTNEIDKQAFTQKPLAAYHPPRPGYDKPEPGVSAMQHVYHLESPQPSKQESGVPVRGREPALNGPAGYSVPGPDIRPVQGMEPSQYPVGAPTRPNLGSRPKQVRPPKVVI